MGYIDDASGKRAEQDIWSAIRKLQTASPLDNASVENGSTRFIGNESLKVIGSALVSGWLIVTGTLKIVGTLLLEGVTTITGSLTAKGTTRFEGDTTQVGAHHVQGNQDITGTLAVKGVATLENDLNLVGGGKIVAGATIFNPSGILSSSTALTLLGSTGINLSGSTTIGGQCTFGSLANATGPANAFLTSSGVLQRMSSARRFKIDPRSIDLNEALLDVPVKEWIDLGNAERFAALYIAPRPFTREQQADYDGADLKRVPGVIAEEVEAAGGRTFVTYDGEGRIEGVAYDRLALARTQILADRLEAALARIEELENRP